MFPVSLFFRLHFASSVLLVPSQGEESRKKDEEFGTKIASENYLKEYNSETILCDRMQLLLITSRIIAVQLFFCRGPI